MLFIASDHAGFELKTEILKRLDKKILTTDLGTNSTESTDYPLFAQDLAKKVLDTPQSLGLLICGSGIGMSIAANRFSGIRAACVSEPESAKLSREHNNANVLCLGARILNVDQAMDCLEAFLNARFDTSSPRHQRRIDQLDLQRKP